MNGEVTSPRNSGLQFESFEHVTFYWQCSVYVKEKEKPRTHPAAAPTHQQTGQHHKPVTNEHPTAGSTTTIHYRHHSSASPPITRPALPTNTSYQSA